MLIACSRMYNVAPGARAAWDDLFACLARTSGIPLKVIPYPAPLPLAGLWGRRDLGVAFMCGWPFITTREAERPHPLATPVPTAAWAKGKPCYATHLMARDDTGLTDLTAAAGLRLGWTVLDSQSGYHAVRHYLVSRPDLAQCPFETVGPLLNPTGVIAALRSGTIDIGPIDAYAHALMERYAPADVAGLRILATTSPAPAPLLVAAHYIDRNMAASLRQALVDMSVSTAGARLLDAVCLSGFVHVPASKYAVLLDRHMATSGVGAW